MTFCATLVNEGFYAVLVTTCPALLCKTRYNLFEISQVQSLVLPYTICLLKLNGAVTSTSAIHPNVDNGHLHVHLCKSHDKHALHGKFASLRLYD